MTFFDENAPHRAITTAACRILSAIAVCSAAAQTGALHAQELMTAKSLPDLVAEAEWIGVADLVDAQPHMNAKGNLIVTDYHFRQQTSLLGAPPSLDFVLTQGGGTLRGVTDHLSDTADLEVGHPYVIFVRPGRDGMWAPFVGGAQGAFELTPDGHAVSLGILPKVSIASDFIDEVRGLASARGDVAPRAPINDDAPHTMAYPSKTYRGTASAMPMAATSAPLLADAPAGPDGHRPLDAPAPQSLIGTVIHSIEEPFWHYDHRISPPAAINAFPHDWSWHPFEEYQLAYWNQFGGSVFTVYTTPSPNWSYGDGVFDLAGFPSNDDMIAQFGVGWTADGLGITYSRWVDDGPTIEADTALNPARCWTLDDRQGTDETGTCWSFRRTMVHEVGHSWGLRHPWETQAVSWDAVLNYAPHEFRFPYLFLDDTAAVRNAFGGVPVHDAALALYTTSYAGSGSQSAAYTSTQAANLTIRHGENLSALMANQFKIENTGTDDIVSPQIDFYLSQNRMDFNNTVAYIGSGTGSTVPVGFVLSYWLPNLAIPASTPTGDYWFAGFLPAADAVGANNAAWTRETTKVHVDNNAATLVPQATWGYSEVGSLGPAGTWRFALVAEAGVVYDLSLCSADGGFASFDTTLTISDGSGEAGFNDDSCDLQSSIEWTAPSSGTFTVTIGSYHSQYQGSFQLAYRREILDPVFANGFD